VRSEKFSVPQGLLRIDRPRLKTDIAGNGYSPVISSPVGTADDTSSVVPTGLKMRENSGYPAINCRAILRRPSGTENI